MKERKYPVKGHGGKNTDNESKMGTETFEEFEDGRMPEANEGRNPRSYLKDYAKGYNAAPDGLDDRKHTEEEVERGFEVLGSLDFDDMFCAFDEPNYGLVGGSCTVDDFTPEGVTDRKDRGQDSMRDLHEEQHSGSSKRSGSGGYQQKYP